MFERSFFAPLGALFGTVVGAVAGAGVFLAAQAGFCRVGNRDKQLADFTVGVVLFGVCTAIGLLVGAWQGWKGGAGAGARLLARVKRGSDDGYNVAGLWLGGLAGGVGVGLGAAYGLGLGAGGVTALVLLGIPLGAVAGVFVGAAVSLLNSPG